MPYNEIGSSEPMDLWGIFILKKVYEQSKQHI
jgi:hypothetical protein